MDSIESHLIRSVPSKRDCNTSVPSATLRMLPETVSPFVRITVSAGAFPANSSSARSAGTRRYTYIAIHLERSARSRQCRYPRGQGGVATRTLSVRQKARSASRVIPGSYLEALDAVGWVGSPGWGKPGGGGTSPFGSNSLPGR